MGIAAMECVNVVPRLGPIYEPSAGQPNPSFGVLPIVTRRVSRSFKPIDAGNCGRRCLHQRSLVHSRQASATDRLQTPLIPQPVAWPPRNGPLGARQRWFAVLQDSRRLAADNQLQPRRIYPRLLTGLRRLGRSGPEQGRGLSTPRVAREINGVGRRSTSTARAVASVGVMSGIRHQRYQCVTGEVARLLFK
jgi:hypothetical protein